ncbi:MAG: tRNA (N(6)-L-threonylcarbamoyladenosine(37)-C(2))-methylthiotransferase MtaB, partial [Alphaproteobacteria bacterium]
HGAGLDDTIIFNTCAVTAEAERQARQAIRRARRQSPDACIIVTGCAAQIDPDRYAAMAEVDQVLGNAEKLDPAAFTVGNSERVRVNDIMALQETAAHLVSGFEGRARAFVQVQNGCDHRCTFCIIPFGRGNSRSVPLGEVVAQADQLVAAGYNEIVLTGVDLTSYGGDLPGRPSLGQMTRRLLAQVPDLQRLRLSSIDVAEVDGDLMDLIAHELRLMPHLHLSLQAGDDMVLKRMKRRHSHADAIAFCQTARALRPDIAFGADLIAGFPTEDDAMFQRSLDLVTEAGLAFLHVFPYSGRAGTPAARITQVPKSVRKDRAARLRAAGDAALAGYLAGLVGRDIEVLVEQGTEGRSEHYAKARLDSEYTPGTLVNASVTGAENGVLMATAR